MEKVDSSKVDSLLQFVGLEKVELAIYEDSKWLRKALPGVKLDFSAIAKGYGVDLLGQVLEARDITDYLVDIGGETLAKGQSPRQTAWQLGISLPKEEASLRDLQTTVPLQDQALATSGNYRNFYEVDGVKYSHTINPKTGYPERNTLLSASVFAPDCMTADAYATAFMALGAERGYELASQLPTVEAYFIFSQPDGSMDIRYTPRFKCYICRKREKPAVIHQTDHLFMDFKLDRELVFFDIEATGLNVVRDRIMQIGMIKYFADDREPEELEMLINPSFPITEEALQVHGITPQRRRQQTDFPPGGPRNLRLHRRC